MVIPERIERKYEPYPEYRDSGVEWLAKVPTQWNIIRLKYGVSLINDKVENGESDTPYLGLENVESWTGRIIETDFKPEIGGASNSFRKDDVLFGKLRPYLAKAVHAQYHGICTSELMVLRPQKYYSRFLFYYMLSPSTVNIIDSSTYGVKMPRANWHFIGNLPVVVPPMPEQQAIADFLDRETARIDEMIARKQRLIELLQEQRTALITRIVTKGLSSDVPMKDSGVEWLGEIPANWEVKKLKYVAEIITGNTPPKSDPGNYDELEGLPWIKPDNLGSFLPVSASQEYLSAKGATLARIVPKEAILTCCIGSIGSIGIAGCELSTNQQINSVVFSGQRVHHKYGFYMVYASLPEYRKLANLNVVAIINSQSQKTIPIPLPPLPEQQTIADYLDQETARIDNLVGRINQAIEKLQEYRSALITAAVTGKIDVRQHVS